MLVDRVRLVRPPIAALSRTIPPLAEPSFLPHRPAAAVPGALALL